MNFKKTGTFRGAQTISSLFLDTNQRSEILIRNEIKRKKNELIEAHMERENTQSVPHAHHDCGAKNCSKWYFGSAETRSPSPIVDIYAPAKVLRCDICDSFAKREFLPKIIMKLTGFAKK